MTFSHVSKPVRNLTGKTFARKFITLGKVINYWAEAVGPDLAAKTYPINMKVRKAAPLTGKNNAEKQNLEAVLEIAASSADAVVLHYQKSLILERLKTLLGASMIVDIKITHAARTLAPPKAPSAPLTNASKTCLSHGIENIADPELREILQRLGDHIVHNTEKT